MPFKSIARLAGITLTAILLTAPTYIPASIASTQTASAPSVLLEGDKLLLAGEYSRAATLYRQSVEKASKPEPAVLLHLAATLLKRDDASAALEAAERAVASGSTSDAFAMRALALFRAGRFRDADHDRNRALAVPDRGILADLADARLAASEGRTSTALDSLTRFLTGTSVLARVFRPDALLLQADILEESDRTKESLAAMERAVAEAPRTNELFVANLTAAYLFRQSVRDRSLIRVRSEGTTPRVVPMDIRMGLLLVTASVNGSGPARFIVDTGAGICVLFPKSAASFGIRPRPEQAWAGAVGGDGKVGMHYGLADTVTLGGATVENVPFGIIDWEAPGIAGIIGLPLLKRFDVTFDYGASQLLLAPIGTSSITDASATAFRLVGGAMFVEATINGGGPFNFEIDTGASPVAVPVDVRLAAALRLKADPGRKARGKGASGAQEATIHPGVSIAWGKLPPVTVDLMAQPITPARPERRDGESGLTNETEVDGLVGFGLLRGRVLQIDFAAHRLSVR